MASTLGWYISGDIWVGVEAPVSMPGIGLSIEYHLQSFLAETFPGLSVALHVLLFPVLAFYFSLKIIRYFLDDAWSMMLALLFFSNVAGFPFHLFALETVMGDFSTVRQSAMKMSDISTVVGIAALSRLLSPSNLYRDESFVTFALLAAIIFLDSLDASAISVVYIVMAALKFYSHPLKRKVLTSYLAGIIFLWVASIAIANPTDIYTSDLPELSAYIGLYFALPSILFLVSLATLDVDCYQVLRRFSGLILVFVSELTIIGLHYADLHRIQLSEVQFQSVFPLFHILYLTPPLFWTLNSDFSRWFLNQGTSAGLSAIKGNLGFGLIVISMCFLALYNFRALP
ncbi:hypothetical protein OAW18_07870 [Alphaproteobacteria bacterium]|nr:hypothetical protein [Alphaproteobacteria bacterium]